ncbi:MAG: hypothetical protein KC468_04005 [Myxococcales bacterium]|nr:hypothetical protein [Myxococcales bacterium]
MPRPPGLSPPSARIAHGRSPAAELVAQLVASFREQVRRALAFDLDGSIASLAVVDHYLAQARGEQREPILSLLAAGAGAYVGDLVCNELGAQWIGDRDEPRRLRLLLRHHFLFLAPVDQAYEAILGETPDLGDPRLPRGAVLDTSFHLQTTPEVYDPDSPSSDDARDDAQNRAHEQSDADWVHDQLAHRPPLPEHEFYSMTGRFETLQLIVELLSARRAAQGRAPRVYAIEDYLRGIAEASTSE